MSSPVSPCQWRYRHVALWLIQLHSIAKSRKHSNVSLCVAASARYRGSGSIEPKGLTHSRKAAFLQGWKSCNVDSFKPLRRSAPPPLSALRARQRRTLLRICPHSHRKHTHIRKHTEEDIATFQPHSGFSARLKAGNP